MAETCIACLSTQNPIDITEKEWMVFDMLLHPISKQYPSIRTNHLAKMCINCKCSINYVEKFRKSALNNFLLLMNVWNTVPTSSTSVYSHNIKNEEIQYDKKDKKELIEIEIKAESDVLDDSNKKTDIVDGLTGETDMLNNLKEETNMIDDLKEETNIVDDITEETNVVDNGRQNNMPAFYNGHASSYYTVWTNMDNVISNNCVYTKDSNKPGEAQHTIHDDMNLILCSMLQTPSQLPSIPPKVSPMRPKEIKILPKEIKFLPKGTEGRDYSSKNPDEIQQHTNQTVKYPMLSILPLQSSPKMMPKRVHSSKMCNKQCRVHIESPVNCTECGKQCKNEYCLKRHTWVSHSKMKYCEVCDKHFRPSGFSRHLKTHNRPEDTQAPKEETYCEVCEKWVSLKSYKTHIKTTLKHITKNDYKYTCDYCSEKFVTKVVLRDHIAVVHLNLNPYKCPHCPMEFKNHSNRGRHVRLVHEKRSYEKKYVCDFCGKAWQTSRMLQDHMSTHTGARPHKCGKCDATFGHKSALFLHNRYKHEKKKCPPKKKKNATKTTE